MLKQDYEEQWMIASSEDREKAPLRLAPREFYIDMGSNYARGKRAIAECDRCGFRYKLKELKTAYNKDKKC